MTKFVYSLVLNKFMENLLIGNNAFKYSLCVELECWFFLFVCHFSRLAIVCLELYILVSFLKLVRLYATESCTGPR